MKKLSLSVAVILFALGSSAFAAANDGSDLPACKGVTDVCLAANVTATDSKTGKVEHGYVAGEHARDGKGLWADCVAPLAKGKTVEGVTGVSADAAKACLQAEKAAHPKRK
ncbi:MAG: hypothetical protein ACXVAX_03920 [Pseudobdellovibrio sp.]